MAVFSLCKLSVETYLTMHKEAFDKIYDPNDDKAYTLTANIGHLRGKLEEIKDQFLEVDGEDDDNEFKDDDTLPEEPRLCNAAQEVFENIDSILHKRLGLVQSSEYESLYMTYII